MGKAAERNRIRRARFLARLAEQDPIRFEREWGKRIESWGQEIRCIANKGKIAAKPVFGIAERAGLILAECGPAAVALQGLDTRKVLENECCRGLAHTFGKDIYRMNHEWSKRR